MNEVQLLKNLISIDSQCSKSNKKIVDFIVSLFPAKNCFITPLKKADLNLYNLEIRFKGKKSGRPLIFSGHTDTVPTSNRWKKDPFHPVVSDNKIYGLGSSDMKAGVACMIKTAQSLIGIIPACDVIFLFDADEEGGCTGGKSFIKNKKIKAGSAKVVVCEPTGGRLRVGQKGAIEIYATFRGKAFHASRTSFAKNLKLNAIHKALQGMKELEKLEKELEKKKDKQFNFPTQAICRISGGTAVNVIPDECSFVINRRVLPSENMDQIVKQISGCLKKIDPRVEIKIGFLGAPNLLPLTSELLKITKKITEKVWKRAVVAVEPGWTQAGLFKKWGDCLIWGPGEITMAHQADEYCPIGDLEKMTTCYKKLIELQN